MKIALVQMDVAWGSVDRNLRATREYVRKAASRDADLIVFPETSVHGIWKDSLLRVAAEPVDGPIVKKVTGWARRHRIAVGFGMAERTSGKPYNSYILADKTGHVVGVYRKNRVTHLEREFFRCGTRRPLFNLLGRKIAVGICADNLSEKLLTGFGRRGAEIVLMPHAWDADPILKSGRIACFPSMAALADTYAKDLVERYRTHDEMLEQFSTRIAAAAARYGFYAIFVNATGTPHPLVPSVGPCFVADPDGKVILRTHSRREQMLMARIP